MAATQIWTVEATDFPKEVEDYCDEHEISTHCSCEMIQVTNDGNVLAEWLKTEGVVFPEGRRFIPVGVFGT